MRKRTDTKDSAAFWHYIEETAALVNTWPAWKRGSNMNEKWKPRVVDVIQDSRFFISRIAFHKDGTIITLDDNSIGEMKVGMRDFHKDDRAHVNLGAAVHYRHWIEDTPSDRTRCTSVKIIKENT
jgi:hypothetical protein